MKKQIADESGFTLIELMVVVIILGILAGLVVPRIMERPGKAKQTKAKILNREFRNGVKAVQAGYGSLSGYRPRVRGPCRYLKPV